MISECYEVSEYCNFFYPVLVVLVDVFRVEELSIRVDHLAHSDN